MPADKIDQVLQMSWQTQTTVLVQLDVLEHHQYVAEFSGQVLGFNANKIYLQLPAAQLKTVYREDIRAARLATTEKWWDHDDTLGWS